MTVQPVNSPSPATLAQVARLLGYAEIHHHWQTSGWQLIQDGGGYEWWRDGDLLLAILNKAAEMGHRPILEWCKEIGWNSGWRCAIGRADVREYIGQAHASTALEAVLTAFAALAGQGEQK